MEKKSFCSSYVRPEFTQDEMQKKIDKPIKHVQYSVKHETVLPWQLVDCHLILADFLVDQFSLRINDIGEKP